MCKILTQFCKKRKGFDVTIRIGVWWRSSCSIAFPQLEKIIKVMHIWYLIDCVWTFVYIGYTCVSINIFWGKTVYRIATKNNDAIIMLWNFCTDVCFLSCLLSDMFMKLVFTFVETHVVNKIISLLHIYFGFTTSLFAMHYLYHF